MHKRFDHKSIEKKWQKSWGEDSLYEVGDREKAIEKEYVLIEWPYPSGNLHIGHWYAFAVPDIYVRLRRMQGVQMLFPMGFDAFGLPAENAALKHNVSPRTWTEQNIEYMQTQLASMGNSFSWNKTCNSTDPAYFKWTQWMFTVFFENKIAYRGEGVVNWCPGCNTVIANEQVEADGTCERSGDLIEKRKMPQWMLKITDFADALVDDLDKVDWPEHVKEAQRNWIGRSKGAEIDFALSNDETVSVFTTRPDTLYGATYLVLAPEHALLEQMENHVSNWSEVTEYKKQAQRKDERDRLDASKEKTGVKLEGLTATNPVTGEEIPVFIADYVLVGYGTGAIMAVPAHDERDYQFAEKYDLPVKTVISEEDGCLINSGDSSGLSVDEAKQRLTKKAGGRITNTYRLRDWSIGRQRYWGVPIPVVYDPEGNAHIVPKEHLPWKLPTDVDFRPTGEAPLAKSKELKERTESIFGPGWTPEVETMDTFVDSSWYFLRYIDNDNDNEFSSKQAQENWMQVDTYFGGAEHTNMHLLYSRFWQKALHSLGHVVHNEPYIKRVNRGLIIGPDGHKMSKSKGNVVDPDEQVALVGADTVKMYLAFMGPYQGTNYPWDNGGIAGIHRFLERVNGLSDHINEQSSEETVRLLHKTIQKVTNDTKEYKFNTAISSMMVFVNHVEKEGLDQNTFETFIKVLAPYAPHLTEELWSVLEKEGSVHREVFPEAAESMLREDTVTIGVQINGKVRGQITLAADADEQTALSVAKADSDISSRLENKEISKVIYIPGRILNLIIAP